MVQPVASRCDGWDPLEVGARYDAEEKPRAASSSAAVGVLAALSSNSINYYGHISYRANVPHPLAARAKVGLRIHQPRGTLRL